jgi:hypothetical protein
MSREIDAAIAEAREAFRRLRGSGAPSPIAAPGAPVSATVGVPAPPAPAPVPTHWLANPADHDWKQHCGIDGVIAGGLNWGGISWENNR